MAKSIASTAAAVLPLPLASRNFNPMRRVVQFTPTTPVALLPTAPIVPDTCVPWMLSSLGSHDWVMALYPCEPAAQEIVAPLPPASFTLNAVGADQMLAARSGCV